MVELGKAGLDTSQILGGAVQGALDIAATEGIELGTAATIAANAMNMFGLKAKDMPAIADALAGAATASTASVHSLGIALSQVGPGAKLAGLSLQETVAAIAALDQSGIKGSDAGTSLKTFLINLTPQTQSAASAFDDLGLSVVDAAGNFKPLTEIADQLQKGLSKLPKADQTALLKKAFGTDAYRAAAVLGKEGAKGLEKYLAATTKVGAAHAMAEARTKDYTGALERMQGGFETLHTAIGLKFLPALTTAMNFVSEKITPAVTAWVESIDEEKLSKGVESFTKGLEQAWPKIQEIGGQIKDAFGEVDTGALKDSMGSLETAARNIAAGIGAIFDAFTGLSPQTQANIATVVAAGSALAVLSKSNPVVKIGVDLVAGAIGTISETLLSRVFRGTQPVKVTNWPRVYPDGTPDGTPGGPGRGRPRGAAIAGGIAGTALLALVLPQLESWLAEKNSALSQQVLGAAGVAAYTAMGFQMFGPVGGVAGFLYGALTQLSQDNTIQYQKLAAGQAQSDYLTNQNKITVSKQDEQGRVQVTQSRSINTLSESSYLHTQRIGELKRGQAKQGDELQSEKIERYYADNRLRARMAENEAKMAALGRRYAEFKARQVAYEPGYAPPGQPPRGRASGASPVYQTINITVPGAGSPATVAREIERYVRRAGDRQMVSVTG